MDTKNIIASVGGVQFHLNSAKIFLYDDTNMTGEVFLTDSWVFIELPGKRVRALNRDFVKEIRDVEDT